MVLDSCTSIIVADVWYSTWEHERTGSVFGLDSFLTGSGCPSLTTDITIALSFLHFAPCFCRWLFRRECLVVGSSCIRRWRQVTSTVRSGFFVFRRAQAGAQTRHPRPLLLFLLFVSFSLLFSLLFLLSLMFVLYSSCSCSNVVILCVVLVVVLFSFPFRNNSILFLLLLLLCLFLLLLLLLLLFLFLLFSLLPFSVELPFLIYFLFCCP